MANKNIIEVESVKSLTNTDSLFVNSGGSLKQILMSDMSVGGGMYDLLWENPSPTAEFAAQTINLDLSGYSFVAIDFYNRGTYWGMVGTADMNIPFVNSSARVIANRYCNISTDAVTITDCKTSTANATATVNNSVLVPYRIYGVRNNLTSLLSPGVKIEKLWSNPSPTAEFGAQTIDILNLQDYDLIMIRAKYSAGAHPSFTGFYKTTIGEKGNINIAVSSIINRSITVNSNSIEFNDCNIRNAYAGSESVINTCGIPVEIYGIKIETTPVIGGMTMDLLWENAKPTSSFAEQNIVLEDAKKYDAIAVVARESITTGTVVTTIAFNEFFTRMIMFYNNRQFRGVKLTKSTGNIYFGPAYNAAYNAEASVDNGALVPEKIYGIKY